MKPSSDSGPTAVPLLEETIPENLARTVAEHAERDALVSVEQGLRFTYAEFSDEVDLLARGLMGIGVGKGDRVGIWSPNYAEWVLVQYATARIGAILVTINPAYRSSELEYVLKQSGISVLVAVESFMTSDYRSMIEGVWIECPPSVSSTSTHRTGMTRWKLPRQCQLSSWTRARRNSPRPTPSTSNTPAAPPASPRAPPLATATS